MPSADSSQISCPLFKKEKKHSELYIPVSPSQHKILNVEIITKAEKISPKNEVKKENLTKMMNKSVIEEFLDLMFQNPEICKRLIKNESSNPS